jgi:hypothetical protein
VLALVAVPEQPHQVIVPQLPKKKHLSLQPIMLLSQSGRLAGKQSIQLS